MNEATAKVVPITRAPHRPEQCPYGKCDGSGAIFTGHVEQIKVGGTCIGVQERYECDCEKERKARIAEIERDRAIFGRRNEAGFPTMFWEDGKVKPFEKSKSQRAYDRVVDWARTQTRRSAYIYGEPGVGKTHLATIAGLMLCRDHKVVWFNFADLLFEATRSFKITRSEQIAKTCEIAIFDDVFTRSLTEAQADAALRIINARYANNRRTLMTGMYGLATVPHLDAMKPVEAICRRIADMCDRHKYQIKMEEPSE